MLGLTKEGASGPGREVIPLTSIRGLAAMWVVALHLVGNLSGRGWIPNPGPIGTNLIRGGDFAVDVFFILSGFILARTYEKRFEVTGFFLNRFARIYPLHVVVLSAMAIGVIGMKAIGLYPGSDTFFSFADLPYYYSLTFIWLGKYGWNGPTWSLCTEQAAYLIFPILQGLAGIFSRWTAVILGSILLCCDFVLFISTGVPVTGMGAVVRGLFGFGAGVLLHKVSAQQVFPEWGAAVCVAAIGVIAWTGTYAFGVFPAAALIVCLSSKGNGVVKRVLSHTWFEQLGLISFSIYLLHDPLLIVAMQVIRRVPALQSTNGAVLFGFTYVVVLLFCSVISYHLLELPARKWIRGFWAR
jgi:peptidoglycan/LPS O-acetylase OafA/YrhL